MASLGRAFRGVLRSVAFVPGEKGGGWFQRFLSGKVVESGPFWKPARQCCSGCIAGEERLGHEDLWPICW